MLLLFKIKSYIVIVKILLNSKKDSQKIQSKNQPKRPPKRPNQNG
jgi:hypothetical protein